MSIDRIQLLPDHLEDGSVAQSDNAQDHTGRAHFARGPFSRRHFMGAAAGAAGLALGSGLWTPARGQEDEEEDDLATVPPKPIPGGVFFAPAKVFIHHFPPGTANEPSEITDLNGLVADTRILGTGTGTDTTTGTSETLLYQADMGIMKGLYIGEDGRRHRGTFAFIWLDLFKGQADPAHQVHDYNPGIPPSGLFWVQAISADSASVDLAAEKASLSVTSLAIPDFHDVINALKGGPSVSAFVSFDVKWSGATRRLGIRNETDGFVGRYIEDKATIKWSAVQKGFKFESEPKQSSVYAVIGRERNGVFFRDDDEEKD